MEQNIKILAIETSGAALSVAVSENSEISAEYTVYRKNYHDKYLAEFIKRITNDLALQFDVLSAVAVSAGPGSYTGLRIGASIAKGLCFEGTTKFIAVPTLHAVASYGKELKDLMNFNNIIAICPSHKNLVYLQKFNNFENVGEIVFDEIENIGNFVNQDDLVIGDAGNFVLNNVKYYKKQLTASAIAKLGCEYYSEGKFVNAEEFVPLYVQEFEPKTKKI